jgi:glycosyltransferase involved in cell wall biosynthesis
LKNKKKLAIITCCLDDWGGSEELWARSVPYLLDADINLTIYKNSINKDYPEFKKLAAQQVAFRELEPTIKLLGYITSKVGDILKKVGGKIGVLTYQWNKPKAQLLKYLKSDLPDFVLISQGINFDGLIFAYQCLQLNIPYIIVSHKAVDFYWPETGDRAFMQQTLLKAKKCLFVSRHNLKMTEEQFGIRLKNSEIVINPVKTKVEPLPYPTELNGIRLACIGRYLLIDKGQDILLRILQQPKWQEREISISFIGKGTDGDALKEMAKLLGLKNVNFLAYNEDIKNIWATHHGLILPSRSEGLPLTIIEAMSFGRVVIASNAGGNNEIIENGITGFIGEANESAFDEAMEIAWQNKNNWEEIGLKSAKFIESHIPKLPEKIFSELIINHVFEAEVK